MENVDAQNPIGLSNGSNPTFSTKSVSIFSPNYTTQFIWHTLSHIFFCVLHQIYDIKNIDYKIEIIQQEFREEVEVCVAMNFAIQTTSL